MLLMIEIITFFLASIGSYMIMTDRMKVVGRKVRKTAKAFHGLNKRDSSFDDFIEELAGKLSVHIHMDEYKQKKLKADLRSLNINQEPESYQAAIYIKSAIPLVVAVLLLFFIPLASIGFIVFAIILYFKNESVIKEQLQEKREEIQNELPRFACTINQELKSSRDVLSILENYKVNAGKSMKEELDITVADMRSGNYEAALLRFEGRISIASLSDIVRGLIGVLRGDNNIGYFEMLSHDLDIIEVQRLENIAMRQPGKIKKYLFALLMCTIGMYMTILTVYVITMTANGGGI